MLDVAGGTGDIAFRIADSIRACPRPSTATEGDDTEGHEIVICDINDSMLKVGKQRLEEHERLSASKFPIGMIWEK